MGAQLPVTVELWLLVDKSNDPRQKREALLLAEDLRWVTGKFVRNVRSQAGTPTTSQSETLGLLEREGPMSVAALAVHRKVKHQSMRLVAAQLEAAELVAKRADPADGRSGLLSLTAQGRQALSQSREARTSRIATLIEERLSDEERRTLEAAIAVIERLS